MSGNGHRKAIQFQKPPQRIVSLVPSMTESLFDLGLGHAVVGATDFCIHPAPALVNVPRVGGPKNPRIADIISLKPDLVVANQEENTPQTVEALERAGIQVWVSFPQTVRQAMDVLWTMAGIFQDRLAAARLEAMEGPLDWYESAAAGGRPRRYFCPIWQDETSAGQRWWMTFNQNTYAHDLLRLLGGDNVFAARVRRYPLAADLGQALPQDPGEHDTRYPRVTLEEILAADPEVILLPSEPYVFAEHHQEEMLTLLESTQAARNHKVYLVDGSLITWHGTRLARALRELPALLEGN